MFSWCFQENDCYSHLQYVIVCWNFLEVKNMTNSFTYEVQWHCNYVLL